MNFIKGRFMRENIRWIYDLKLELEWNDLPGIYILMLFDLEKAFDIVSWKFIQETQYFFIFCISIQNLIILFYYDMKSRIIQNGIISQYFSPERSYRQDDPIFPYLFLLCAETQFNFLKTKIVLMGSKNISSHKMEVRLQ